jgi:hypothetical protein
MGPTVRSTRKINWADDDDNDYDFGGTAFLGQCDLRAAILEPGLTFASPGPRFACKRSLSFCRLCRPSCSSWRRQEPRARAQGTDRGCRAAERGTPRCHRVPPPPPCMPYQLLPCHFCPAPGRCHLSFTRSHIRRAREEMATEAGVELSFVATRQPVRRLHDRRACTHRPHRGLFQVDEQKKAIAVLRRAPPEPSPAQDRPPPHRRLRIPGGLSSKAQHKPWHGTGAPPPPPHDATAACRAPPAWKSLPQKNHAAGARQANRLHGWAPPRAKPPTISGVRASARGGPRRNRWEPLLLQAPALATCLPPRCPRPQWKYLELSRRWAPPGCRCLSRRLLSR